MSAIVVMVMGPKKEQMADWSNAPEIVQFVRYPASAAVVGTCTSIWIYIWQHGLDYSHLGSSYRLVVIERQYWRAFTASFSHISVVHLGFNMFSTWQLRTAEMSLGSLEYFRLTLVFLYLSIFFQQLLHSILARTRWAEITQNTIGVGYSCVVFAWMTFVSMQNEKASLDLVFFKVPFSLSPFMSLILTQMIIPNVDFVGHLAGILAGFIVCWGLVEWFVGYWLVQIAMWGLILFVGSWKWSGKSVPFIEAETLSDEEFRAVTLREGVGRDLWDSRDQLLEQA